MKIQQVLMCGVILIACAHESIREDAAAGAYAPEEGGRIKGGSSAAFRIKALIGSGQYAEAEALIAESIASGLLTRAAGEELGKKLWKANDEREDKGRDSEPRRPPPYVKKSEEETCSSRFPHLEMCAALPDGYSYHSEQQALNAMKKELNQKNLSLHGAAVATRGPCADVGTHVNVRMDGKRVGSIVCCPCCVGNADVGPVEWTKCRIVW
ncbi:hypothetical protein JQX13_19470 [Archangium violaceum]|uniref:hypothetical protein n=1 Tax=Archangium violaceum TaxID=83451 RepID=UPI00193BA4BF|nr:hypothetical protein [Archangium violaceum]QRK12027.1 hypothetical protein JQX13_19470 [Archangium violaceum]